WKFYICAVCFLVDHAQGLLSSQCPEIWRTPMTKISFLATAIFFIAPSPSNAGQAPFSEGAPEYPVSGLDRVYVAEQFSNTISVIDPLTNRSLGVIRLGDTQPTNLSPLYKGQVLVHGLGFSPDRKTLAVVSIASNSVTFIETATNKILK